MTGLTKVDTSIRKPGSFFEIQAEGQVYNRQASTRGISGVTFCSNTGVPRTSPDPAPEARPYSPRAPI